MQALPTTLWRRKSSGKNSVFRMEQTSFIEIQMRNWQGSHIVSPGLTVRIILSCLIGCIANCSKINLASSQQFHQSYSNQEFLSSLGKKPSIDSGSLAKINAISEFKNMGNAYSSNFNKEFHDNYKSNPAVFRRSKGALCEFADHGSKHSFISSPFGRR